MSKDRFSITQEEYDSISLALDNRPKTIGTTYHGRRFAKKLDYCDDLSSIVEGYDSLRAACLEDG